MDANDDYQANGNRRVFGRRRDIARRLAVEVVLELTRGVRRNAMEAEKARADVDDLRYRTAGRRENGCLLRLRDRKRLKLAPLEDCASHGRVLGHSKIEVPAAVSVIKKLKPLALGEVNGEEVVAAALAEFRDAWRQFSRQGGHGPALGAALNPDRELRRDSGGTRVTLEMPGDFPVVSQLVDFLQGPLLRWLQAYAVLVEGLVISEDGHMPDLHVASVVGAA